MVGVEHTINAPLRQIGLLTVDTPDESRREGTELGC